MVSKLSTGIYSDAPLARQTVVFSRAGFHDSKHANLTPYEGRPNKENNATWDRLMGGVYTDLVSLTRMTLIVCSVGVATVSAEEASKLVGDTTAKSRNNKQDYIVEISVFHQLHCLVSDSS